MRLGIDFGGTKIEAAALDSTGEIRARQRVENPGSYEGAITALKALVERIESETGERAHAIGVGMPGSISPANGLIRNSNSIWLNGKPFLQDLERTFARPVRLENDANCFALSEAVDGAAAGARVVFGVILGTGCGGGIVVDKRTIEGASRIAGEWGHTPLPWRRASEPSQRDWCGRWDCLEQWISGTGFRRWSGMAARDAVAKAAQGDGAAIAALDLLADRIARSLSVIINILDPDVIVLGGGLSNIDALYPSIRGKLIAHVISEIVGTKVVKNKHGDSSGVRGAAWLFTPEDVA